MHTLPIAGSDRTLRRIRGVLTGQSASVEGELAFEHLPDTIAAHDMHLGRAMQPEYPLEQVCTHLYEPFQLNFARHAEPLLSQEDEVEVEATHRGLVLRGETEAALDRAIQRLRSYFGNQIRVAPAIVRYHHGATVEEPHMALRVGCPAEHFEAVKAGLIARDALIVASIIDCACGEIRATAPLAKMMGYARSLTQLTLGTAHEVMWLSHYAAIQEPPPDDTDMRALQWRLEFERRAAVARDGLGPHLDFWRTPDGPAER